MIHVMYGSEFSEDEETDEKTQIVVFKFNDFIIFINKCYHMGGHLWWVVWWMRANM